MTDRYGLTERFRRAYLPGFDCRLASLRNSLAAQGHAESNAMILGLSGALCFVFAEAGADLHTVPFHSIVGVTDQSIEGITSSFNTYTLSSVAAPNGGAAPFGDTPASQWLRQGVPVHLAVHRPTLHAARTDARRSRSSANAYDVAAHYVTITDHDERGGFTVFESDDGRPFTVQATDLEQAWFYDLAHDRPMRDPLQPCAGRWFAMRVAGDVSMLRATATRHAIERVVHGFHHPTAEFMGAPALDRFALALARWPADTSDPAIGRAIAFLPVFEGALSGGGLGRKLYGRFLNEAAGLLRDESLRDAARLFAMSADGWRAFAAALRATLLPPKRAGGAPRVAADALARALDAHLDALVAAERRQMAWLRDWTAASLASSSASSSASSPELAPV